MQQETKQRLKIASVSLNQTVYDWARNTHNIFAAVDKAAADGADILSTEELSLVGYSADDYHQWNKDNKLTWEALRTIAAYAAEKDPNLVVTIGVPWHYADKSKHASDPEYNINNRPFNAHAVITGGRVIAMAAKSILADGAAEYEPRQFSHWPSEKGTIRITLPDGSRIPFGKPVIALEEGRNRLTLAYEICAEGWPGLQNDLSVNVREQNEARYIAALSQTYDLSVVLNPSASKPEPALNKEHIRAEGLCKTGSRYAGVYVYTNHLGSASGTYGAEGSQIFAQDGQIIHHGYRYSFQDMSYSSAVVALPVAVRGEPDVGIPHRFAAHSSRAWMGREAPFDAAFAMGQITLKQLSYEEYMRTIALWLRDYLAKQNHKPQGYVVSLSGGKDSGYGALAVSMMVDLDIQENGVEGFFKRFSHLSYKNDVLAIYAQKGEAEAVRALKKNILTCVYIPTENSSPETLRAARFLIEGGALPDGTVAQGIGGKFFVAPAQAALDETTMAFVGLDLDQVVRENLGAILGERPHHDLTPQERFDLARAQTLRQIKAYTNAEPQSMPALPDYITRACVNPLATWARAADDITLQNIQARVRLPIPWAIGNQERKMPLATSNASEVVHGYTTAGGDMHMGGANPIGGVSKHAITQSLNYFEYHGLVGFDPVSALHWINEQQPSAELRKVTGASQKQTDETDLGFTYEQSEFIEQRLIVGRQQPAAVLQAMRGHPVFGDDPVHLRGILLGFARRWESGQFKRVMGPLSPHTGKNPDPHQAVRTTVLGDHFRTGAALMTLGIIAEKIGDEAAFARHYGMSLSQAEMAALMNPDFKEALSTLSLEALMRRAIARNKRPHAQAVHIK